MRKVILSQLFWDSHYSKVKFIDSGDWKNNVTQLI